MFGSADAKVSLLAPFRILLTQFKNRGRIGIVVDILDAVQRTHPRGRTKTQIMRGARLSYEQTCRYLDVLMMCDFVRGVQIHQGERELTSYCLTPHGFELFKQLHALHAATELLKRKFV